MNKEYFRNQIAQKRKSAEDVKLHKSQLKEQKARKLEALRNGARSSSSPAIKASYRKQVIDAKLYFDRNIDSDNRRLDQLRDEIARLREQMSRVS